VERTILTQEQVNQLVSLLIGLNPSEWDALKVAVDKEFDSAYSKLTLQDTESLKYRINYEIQISPEEFMRWFIANP